MAEGQTYPGDDVFPAAPMIYDRRIDIKAPPQDVWPWVVQLGKGRGGWYLTAFWESLLPTSWRASRVILPKWQSLQVGSKVPDYGKDEYFDVTQIDEPRSLVYVTERFGTRFTWALLLREKEQGTTTLHLRFRGNIQSTGWRRSFFIQTGDILDNVTTTPMLAGLKERAERLHAA